MSYDIKIWSINKLSFKESLSKIDRWKVQSEMAFIQKNGWQIVLNKSQLVEHEDVPYDVLPLLPGISYLTEINLEPIHSPETAKRLQINIAKGIAKDIIGVIEDPQAELIISPSGVKRYISPKRESKERFSVLEMAWIFNDNKLTHREIIDRLVKYFKTNLPEALPKRYGDYEPPQYIYKDNDKYLKEYLHNNLYNSVIWYPNAPVLSFDYSFTKDWGFSYSKGKKSFKSNHVSLTFDLNVVSQPGWSNHLDTIFKDISMILNPFYAESRILKNQIYGGGTYYLDNLSETSPIAGMWKGIPQKLGQAIMLGTNYINHFPNLKKEGKKLGDLYYIFVGDWDPNKTANQLIGETPKEVMQIKPYKLFTSFEESKVATDEGEKFPIIFPFNKNVKE